MALMWNRTVDWDADDWRRVGRLPQHRTGPLLPCRHDRTGRRPDRGGQARLPLLRRARALPRLRAGHQPGVRRLGRHVRGGAPQAPQGVAGRTTLATRRLLSPTSAQRHATVRRHRGRPHRHRDRHAGAAAVGRRQLLHGDRPLQLADDQVAHDRKAEARRALDVEPLRQARARRRAPRRASADSSLDSVRSTWPTGA